MIVRVQRLGTTADDVELFVGERDRRHGGTSTRTDSPPARLESLIVMLHP
jgi:hypothetical protein